MRTVFLQMLTRASLPPKVGDLSPDPRRPSARPSATFNPWGGLLWRPVVIIFYISLLFCSCGTGKHLRRAEQCYARGEYFEAARHYKAAYTRTSPKLRAERGVLAYKQGECYRRINQTLKAKAAYMNAIRYRYPDSVAHFHLAEALRKNGEYAAAAKQYELFLTHNDSTAARLGLEACRLAQQWKKQPSRYTVRRPSIFFSRRSEYAPMFAGTDADQLYFTSTRKEAKGEDDNAITGMKSADLFLSKRSARGQWQKPEPLAGEVNSDFEEGACAFTADGKTMYFTRCRTSSEAPVYAEIYTSQRSGATWSAPQKCLIVNDTLSSVAHPAVSPAGDYLYFVSDMPGGEGGLDIWRINFTASGFGYVDNPGPPINTPGDEMFPTFAPDGTLYFSSTGHLGMGGLDIFSARLDSMSGRWQVENLRSPVNSQADDFGMTFEPGAPHRGFFASNRGDARGYDHIYSFELPDVHHILKGVVTDAQGFPLSGAWVTVAGDDGTYLKVNTRRDGTFAQELSPGVRYALLASCRGYLNGRQEQATEAVEANRTYEVEFALASITRPVLIENIFYRFARAELTSASATALDELVQMLNDNPTVAIELAAHCDYKGSDAYNQELSQRRAESVVSYLVKKGIAPDRLTAKGYGKQSPKVVDKYALQQAPFLREGDVLTEEFIRNLPKEQQEVCNRLNRRTEFRVTRTTYGL